jgi:tRNA(fMet)-specific endonuclease VapC
VEERRFSAASSDKKEPRLQPLEFRRGPLQPSEKPQAGFNRKRLETFLAGPVLVLPFEDDDSRVAGSVRAALKSVGKPIGAYDLLMAGQALRQGLSPVTTNASECSRVKGLNWQDWAKP